MTSNDSGQYRIEHGELSYRSEVYGSWKLPISEIKLIGEYTNEDGPMADDYFLVFLRANEPVWLEASFYGEGRDEILKELSDILGSELSCGLAHSTTFTSQVIWPDDRKGKRVFDFQPSGWFKNRQTLAPEVQDERNSEGVALNTCPAASSSRHDHSTFNPLSKPRPRAGVRGLRRCYGCQVVNG